MSDRTQTLSVELEREEIERLLTHPIHSGTHSKLCAAISQLAPEVRKFCPQHGLVDQVGIYCNVPMGRRLACGEKLRVEQERSSVQPEHREKTCPGCGGQGCDACDQTGAVPLQPPAPALSHEERERLRKIACWIERAVDTGRLINPDWAGHATFLRDLGNGINQIAARGDLKTKDNPPKIPKLDTVDHCNGNCEDYCNCVGQPEW